jgi:hypothetical protein
VFCYGIQGNFATIFKDIETATSNPLATLAMILILTKTQGPEEIYLDLA